MLLCLTQYLPGEKNPQFSSRQQGSRVTLVCSRLALPCLKICGLVGFHDFFLSFCKVFDLTEEHGCFSGARRWRFRVHCGCGPGPGAGWGYLCHSAWRRGILHYRRFWGPGLVLAKSSEGLHTLAGWLWDRAPGTARLEPRLYEKEERKSQEGKSGEEEQIWVKRPGGPRAGAARGRQRVLPAAGGRVTWKATFSWS